MSPSPARSLKKAAERCIVMFYSGIRELISMNLGIAVRAWQLGLEMRPFFNKESLWAYPLFAGAGASFGYWLQGVDDRQQTILAARRKSLLEKRARRAQREAAEASEATA